MSGSSSQQQQQPVISHFFAQPANGSRPSASTSSKAPPPSLKKQPSIITLSDDSDVIQGEDDDELQIIDVPAKRKASSSSAVASNAKAKGKSKATSLEPAKKKVKVAPLFEKTKTVPSATAVKKEDSETSQQQSLQKLQQWKFSAASQDPNGRAATPLQTGHASTATIVNHLTSSPLPDAPPLTASKIDQAVLKRRAEVRKRLLGVDTTWRRPAEDEESPAPGDSEDVEMQEEDDDGETTPVASTSKSVPASKGKNKKGEKEKENIPIASSKFAKFAAGASSEDSATDKSKGKGKGKSTEKGKGKETAIKYTPLELQVLELKRKNPDTLLIVEVGYKFKFFGEDAKIASRELNIACFMSQNFWSAMIPEHRIQVHIKRLITSGYKVGLVRQIETAALKKVGDNRNAPFTRELTNLYTSATYVEGLDDDTVAGAQPTFGTLMCICEEPKGGKGSDEKVVFGVVAAQPSTGEVIYDQFEDGFLRAELETRLLHIQPGEIVIQGDISAPTNRVISYLLTQEASSSGLAGGGRVDKAQKKVSATKAISVVSTFYGKAAKEELKAASSSVKKKGKEKAKRKGKGKKKAETVELSDDSEGSDREMAIDLTDSQETDGKGSGDALATVLGLPDIVITALAGLLQHLTSFQLQSVFKRPKFFTPFAQRGHMLLNSNTIANLEIFRNQTDFKHHHSLFAILDHTKTPFGQRLLRRWVAKPLLQREELQERIDAVDAIVTSQSYLLGKMRGLLKGLPDLERGLARIHYLKSSPQELVRVLSAFQRIADEFSELPADLSTSKVGFPSEMINDVFRALPKLQPVVKEILEQINVPKAREGLKAEIWTEEYEPEELADCKDVLDTVDAEFADHLKECRKLLKKPALEYITVSQEEYLLEVRIAESKTLPADWLRINGTKSVYRYRSPKMQTLLGERNQAVERLAAEANAAFLRLLASISAKYESFRDVVVKLATIDCLLSLGIVAISPGYVKPDLVEEPCLEIVGGRHPMVETAMDKPFIANDVTFQEDGLRAMVITGCNMSGKSSYSRMVALLVIMAQIGCYVPCQSAKIGIVDYVGTRFGASDEIARGRSTFMVELTETCEILKAATSRSLIVLDELGRGTSTNDGLAIASAVMQYIIKRVKCQTLFITHFPQLADIAARYPRDCKLFQMAYIEERSISGVPDITFLYKLVPGLTDRVHGISCARMAGLPESVCQTAADKSKALEDADHEHTRKRQVAQMQSLLSQLANATDASQAQSATQVVQLAKRLAQK